MAASHHTDEGQEGGEGKGKAVYIAHCLSEFPESNLSTVVRSTEVRESENFSLLGVTYSQIAVIS